jgi:thymidine kinase
MMIENVDDFRDYKALYKGTINFIHGTMGSGKSALLLNACIELKSLNKSIILLTSGKDNRSGTGIIKSRNGKQIKARAVFKEDDIRDILKSYDLNKTDYIFIDEWQFFSELHLLELKSAIQGYDVKLVIFGLMFDYKGKAFTSTENILGLSDNTIYVKKVCDTCNDKLATHHLLYNDGEVVKHGAQFIVGDSEYKSVCDDCFYDAIF